MGRGALGASQLRATILGQNSGGQSQVLLGLLASLNQSQHPLCRLFGTLQGEEVAAALTSTLGWLQDLATQIRAQLLSLMAPPRARRSS